MQRVAGRGPLTVGRASPTARGGLRVAVARPRNRARLAAGDGVRAAECGQLIAGGGLRLADCGFCRKRLDIMANLQLDSRFLTIICGECRVGERFVARDAGPCDSALWAQWRRYLCYPSSSSYFARIVIGDAPRRLSGLVSRCDTRRILLAALGSLPEIIAKNRRLGCRNRRQGGWQRACARKRPAAGRVAGRLRSRGCCGRRAQKTPGSWSGCRASRASWALCAGVPRVGAGGYETVITTLSKRSSGVSAPSMPSPFCVVCVPGSCDPAL